MGRLLPCMADEALLFFRMLSLVKLSQWVAGKTALIVLKASVVSIFRHRGRGLISGGHKEHRQYGEY